jgi:hypothetical protein
VHAYAKKRNYPVYPRAKFSEFLEAAAIAIPAMVTPVIIVGGILMGWFTATESAAAAVLYAAVLSLLVYREINASQFWDAVVETGKLSAVALFCVGTASVFGWLMAYYQIPKALLSNVQAMGMGVTGVGLMIALSFLVVGCFLDAIPAIRIGGHAPGSLCYRGHCVVGLWPDHPTLRHVPHDFMRCGQSALAVCPQGHDDHADPHAGGVVSVDRLPGYLPVPAPHVLTRYGQVKPA